MPDAPKSQGGRSWLKRLAIAVPALVVGTGAWLAFGCFAAKGNQRVSVMHMTASDAATWTALSLLAAVFLGVAWIAVRNLRGQVDEKAKLDVDWENLEGKGGEWKSARDSSALAISAWARAQAGRDFFRAKRLEAKSHAETVLVVTYFANGVIMVIGVVVNIEHWERLGLVSTALGAVVAGLAAWDAHYRNRDLWVERTIILSRIEKIRRVMQYRLARGDNPDSVGDDAIKQYELLLDEDMNQWTALRDVKPNEQRDDGQDQK